MYKCLFKQSIEDKDGYKITALRLTDKEPIREWRNAQIEILRQQTPLTSTQQKSYFGMLEKTFNEDYPEQILFSFLYQDGLIGYGGLTHIDWDSKRAEVSFLLDPKRMEDGLIYKRDFLHFLTLLVRIAFEELKLNRLFTETFSFRKHTIHVLELFGFKHEGILRKHVRKNGSFHDSIMHGLLAEEGSYEK